jgi:hypothetical protein
MTRGTWALLGTFALGVAFATNTGAQRASVPDALHPVTAHAQAATTAKPQSPATPAAAPAATTDPNAVGRHVLRHLSQRQDEARRSHAADLRSRTRHRYSGDRREDDPQAAGRHDAAARLQAPGSRDLPELHQRPGNAARYRRRCQAQSRHQVFTRLNRKEYQAAVRDLLGIEVDAGAWLPLDQMSANFDNIADEQAMSATSVEAYLNAATEISKLAVGDRTAPKVDRTYNNTSYASQHPWDQLEGAPYGTRGGIVVNHVFPADGEYSFEVTVNSGDNSRFEDIDVSLNGERLALLRFRKRPDQGCRRPRRDLRVQREGVHQGRPAQDGRRVRAPLRRAV